MPFSSSALTSEASVKRGGGWVKFCVGVTAAAARRSFSSSAGSEPSAGSPFSASSPRATSW